MDNISEATTITDLEFSEAPAPGEHVGAWACRACTLINQKPEGLACEICATERLTSDDAEASSFTSELLAHQARRGVKHQSSDSTSASCASCATLVLHAQGSRVSLFPTESAAEAVHGKGRARTMVSENGGETKSKREAKFVLVRLSGTPIHSHRLLSESLACAGTSGGLKSRTCASEHTIRL